MVESSGIGGPQGVSIGNDDGNLSLGSALRTLVDAKKSRNHDNENNRLAALSGDLKPMSDISEQNPAKSSDIAAPVRGSGISVDFNV